MIKAEDSFKNMIAVLVVNWLGSTLAILFVYEWPLSEYFDEKRLFPHYSFRLFPANSKIIENRSDLT